MNIESTATSQPADTRPQLTRIADELGQLERELLELESEMSPAILAVPLSQRESAKNLVHYVALRQRELRALQAELAQRGLSSLGRSESCVMRGLLEVSARAHEALIVREQDARTELERLDRSCQAAVSWDSAQQLLHRHTVGLFGPRPSDRHVYVMVTAPSAEEADHDWMVRLLEAGMNVLRINCAHETAAEWERIVAVLERARKDR